MARADLRVVRHASMANWGHADTAHDRGPRCAPYGSETKTIIA
jgi:hypothetical protein